MFRLVLSFFSFTFLLFLLSLAFGMRNTLITVECDKYRNFFLLYAVISICLQRNLVNNHFSFSFYNTRVLSSDQTKKTSSYSLQT